MVVMRDLEAMDPRQPHAVKVGVPGKVHVERPVVAGVPGGGRGRNVPRVRKSRGRTRPPVLGRATANARPCRSNPSLELVLGPGIISPGDAAGPAALSCCKVGPWGSVSPYSSTFGG